VGCTAPWGALGLPRGALRGKGRQGALEVGFSEPVVRFFTTEMSLDNLRDIGWDGVDWIDLAQDRDQWRALVNTAMNLRFP
jgi:hypothetical protein